MTTDSQYTGERLDSWKAIAAFFDRDERTVKRWEKERGLPVHRVPGGGRCTVFAFAGELKAWMHSSETRLADHSTADVDAAGTPHIIDQAVDDEATEAGEAGVHGRQSRFAGLGAPLLQYALSEQLVLHGHADEAEDADDFVPQRTAGDPGRRLLATTAVLILGALFVAGGWRYVEIRSVQGYLLPSVALRHPGDVRRQAEQYYLQGRFYWNQRTPEGLNQATDYFTRASQADPKYALAYAGLADSYNLLREYTSMPGSQAFPLSLQASRKALQLDPALPEAHRALAFAEFNWEWNIAAAEREYRRAIELNPNDPQSHHWYATMLLGLGRISEARAQIEQARRLDPASPAIAADRAVIIANSGGSAEAISQLQALEAADPKFKSPHAYLAGIYFQNKQYPEYFAEARKLAALSQDQKAAESIAGYQKLFLQQGEKAMLEAMLQDQIQDFQHGRGDAVVVAGTYMVLGRHHEAQEYLEKSFQRHEYELINLRNARDFAPLQKDPAFQELLGRLKLAGIAKS